MEKENQADFNKLKSLEKAVGENNASLARSILEITNATTYSKIKSVKSQNFDKAKDFREAEKEFYADLSKIVFDYVLSNKEKYGGLIADSFLDYIKDNAKEQNGD